MKIAISQVLVVALIILIINQLGSYFTSQGLPWYNTVLVKPSWTPPNWVFGVVWQVIYVCCAVVLLKVYASDISTRSKLFIFTLFVVNAVLNVSWSYLFFYKKLILASLYCNLLLFLSVLSLIIALFFMLPSAAWWLIPYAVWLTFALFLNYAFWVLNKYPRI